MAVETGMNCNATAAGRVKPLIRMYGSHDTPATQSRPGFDQPYGGLMVDVPLAVGGYAGHSLSRRWLGFFPTMDVGSIPQSPEWGK